MPNSEFTRARTFAVSAVLFIVLALPTLLFADTITGTVKDPSGAVIAGAQVQITGGDLKKPIVLQSDGTGNFTSPDLPPGNYTVRVTRQGFQSTENDVQLHGEVKLTLTMEITRRDVEVSVSGKISTFANSDPVYRQLRTIGLGETFRLDGFTLPVDVGTFQFMSGTLTLMNPVNGVVTGAVFLGEGHFHLKPVLQIDGRELERRTHAQVLEEDFSTVLFRFTGDGAAKFSAALKQHADTPAEAEKVLEHWRGRLRERRENPSSMSEYLMQGEAMDNVDADVLAAVYNPKHPEFFNAYIHGKKLKDLRFFVRKRVGGLPQMDSPEEVALVNLNIDGYDDGILYLSHLSSEFAARTASSQQDHDCLPRTVTRLKPSSAKIATSSALRRSLTKRWCPANAS